MFNTVAWLLRYYLTVCLLLPSSWCGQFQASGLPQAAGLKAGTSAGATAGPTATAREAGLASGQAAAMEALFAAGSLMGGERGADRRRDAPMIRLKPPPITLLTDSTQIIFFNLVALS